MQSNVSQGERIYWDFFNEKRTKNYEHIRPKDQSLSQFQWQGALRSVTTLPRRRCYCVTGTHSYTARSRRETEWSRISYLKTNLNGSVKTRIYRSKCTTTSPSSVKQTHYCNEGMKSFTARVSTYLQFI